MIRLLPALSRIADDKFARREEDWYAFKETVLWVKLHLKDLSPEDTSTSLQALYVDANNPEWKTQSQSVWELYNKVNKYQPERQVRLT